ncbi:hypothetical protein [Streptomyces coelicoflavus]|uniref:hypothetical protein n=1 Tax=Streptomyces coelicoflavus TaxID=285562 RepID=UPI00362BDFC4
MGRQQQTEEPSRTAGVLVLVVLGGTVLAVVFAVSDAAGILATVAAATVATWWTVSRPVSDMPATPPPGEDRPSCSECAGHELIGVTPSQTQKGMLIYTSAEPGDLTHTHVHIVEGVTER